MSEEEITITQRFENIKIQMCDNYCKFTDGEFTEEEWEQIWHEKCSNCPLREL